MCINEIAPKILTSLKSIAPNPPSQASTRSDGECYLDLPTLQASTSNQVETKSPSRASPLPFPSRPQPLPEITHERGNKFPSITIMPASPPPPKATSPQPLPTIMHAWKKDIPINHDQAHAPRRLDATGRDAAGCATASKLAGNTARPALPSGRYCRCPRRGLVPRLSRHS